MNFKKSRLISAVFLTLVLTTSGASATFSSIDSQWLEKNNYIISVAPETNYPPFIFDDEGGKQAGLSVDFLKEIANISDVTLQFLPSNNLAKILEQAKVGGDFIITSLTKTDERSTFLNFTDSYVDVPAVVFVQANSDIDNIGGLSKKRVGVGEGYGVQKYLEANYDFELITSSDDEGSIAKLIFGQIDAAVMDIATASYLVNENKITGLKMIGTTNFTYHLSFAVPKDSTELLSVLNQMIADSDPQKLDAIKQKWMRIEDVSKSGYIQLIIILVSLATILLISLIYAISKYLSVKTKKLESEKEQLSEVATKHLKELEDTKVAMLNLLEDINDYKIYLEIEKKKRDIAAKKTNIGIWEWDAKTKTASWDEWLYEIFGEHINSKLDPLDIRKKRMGKEDYENFIALRESMLNGKMETAEFKYIIHLDKSVRHMKSSIFVQKNELGEVIKIVGVDIDMTKEKELEKMKDEFLAIASHELRTPMTAIKGLSSMMLHGDYGEISQELRPPLKDMFSATEQLIRLVNNMLNISTFESGRMIFNFTSFNPTDIIISSVNLLQTIAKEKNLNLSAREVSQIPIFSDQDRFKEIMNNLIGNALKFTEKGSVTIYSSEDDDHVNFYIEDTGFGITQENQKKLFQKFQQIRDENIGKPAGSGLGLYISKEMAEHMGGNLWIEKSSSKGTTFAFSVLKPESPLVAKILQAK